jgi:transketolase
VKALRDVFADTLIELGRDNPNVVVLDGDLANSTKADKFAEALPDQFFEMGIAEQNLVGAAVGLASLGFVPWLSSFTVFFTHRAADPVRMLVAQTHANVKIGAAYAGLLTGLTGKTHQDVQDLAIMRAMPGMTVLSPADAHECAAMIRWATAYEGPVYLRLMRDPSADVFGAEYRFELGKPQLIKPGTDILLVSTGTQTARCLEAALSLDEAGHSTGVLHIPSLKPIDAAAVAAYCTPPRYLFTVEEHTILGGLGGLITEILSELSPRRVIRFGIEDRWGESAPNDFLLDRFRLSAPRLVERVNEALGKAKP